MKIKLGGDADRQDCLAAISDCACLNVELALQSLGDEHACAWSSSTIRTLRRPSTRKPFTLTAQHTGSRRNVQCRAQVVVLQSLESGSCPWISSSHGCSEWVVWREAVRPPREPAAERRAR